MGEIALDDETIEVSGFIDAAPFRGPLLLAPLLCGLLMLMEGVDTYSVGYVSPFLMRANHIAPQALGAIYTFGVFASLVGAIGVAPLSDRVGRKRILVATCLLIGVCTILTPFADRFQTLLAARFLIGLGFGAAVPSAFTLTADYAPRRLKALLVMLVSGGVAVGIIASGIAAAFIIPAFGWRTLMYAGGALCVVWSVALVVLLPESVQFLLTHRPGSRETAAITRRLLSLRATSPGVTLYASPQVHVDAPLIGPVLGLVSQGRRLLTFVLWFSLSATYAVIFFLSYWLPTLLMAGGASVKATGLIISTGKVGSIVGSIVIGRLMDRLGGGRVLCATFVIGAVVLMFLGRATSGAALVTGLVVLTCFFVDGSFGGVQALTAGSYPQDIRASATGWITGWARFLGGGAGTLAGGYLVASHWPTARAALLLALPLLVGAVCLLLLLRAPRIAARGEGAPISA